MSNLPHRSAAHPRLRASSPHYPTLAISAVVLAVASCATAPIPVPSPFDPQTLAQISVPLPGDPRAPAPSGTQEPRVPVHADLPPDLLADASPPAFGDGDDIQIGVGCGGGCPPAYVLENRATDQHQLQERVTWCEKIARQYRPFFSGSVSINAQISQRGASSNVVVTSSTHVPAPILSCVQQLVETAKFRSKDNWARPAVGVFALALANKKKK